jgi:hypothetical protein
VAVPLIERERTYSPYWATNAASVPGGADTELPPKSTEP